MILVGEVTSYDELVVLIATGRVKEHDEGVLRVEGATKFWGTLTLGQKSDVEDPVEMHPLINGFPVERTASRFIVSTDQDEHVTGIKRYLDLVFTHPVFHAPEPGQEKFLRLCGAEILSQLWRLST